MEIDDPTAMAALLKTAQALLRSRVQPQVTGEAKLDAAMIANAMGQVARALEHPGTAWSALSPAPHDVGGLRPLVARRLAVTNPGYTTDVADAPP